MIGTFKIHGDEQHSKHTKETTRSNGFKPK